MNTKRQLLILTLLSLATASADQWVKPFKFWWPEQVSVKFENNDGHIWTARQKSTSLRAMSRLLECETLKPVTPGSKMLWYSSIEKDGKEYSRVEGFSKLSETTGAAKIVIRPSATAKVASTTMATAGFPVVVTIPLHECKDQRILNDRLIHEIGGHNSGADHH